MTTMHFWGGKAKGWLIARSIQATAWLGYSRLLPKSLEKKAVSRLWDTMAPSIHHTWGRRQQDPKLPDLIRRHGVRSVLDIGCGSGWLFPMYLELGLQDIIGVDISSTALAIAQRDYPEVETICCRFEEMDFPKDRFDLGISESALQHVPKHQIAGVLQKLCHFCRFVYVKELTDTNPQQEEYYMHKYDYPVYFEQYGYQIVASGQEDTFTWYLFTETSS